MLKGMIPYCGKLTGEDLSRYLNKTESVGLRKAYCERQIGDLTLLQIDNISFPYNMAARRASIDKMSKLSHC